MRVRRRSTASVVAVTMLMMGSGLAGGSAAALPRDAIEPPELPGGGFEPPANGFAWRVPANFGLMRDGLVDYHWNEAPNSRFIGPAYIYDPTYVRPWVRTAYFDGCPTEAELAAGPSTTYTYTWSLHVPASGDPIGLPVSRRNCQWSRDFHLHPVTGRAAPVKVRLAITTEAGAPYPGYPSGKTFDEQLVEVRDILIVSLGDSYGSGEGAPDVPQVINAFGAVEAEARWVDKRCHRSANAPSAVAARQLEAADPHSTVTFLSFACSGATINTEYFADQDKLDPYEHPPAGGFQEPLGSGILKPYKGIEPPAGDHSMLLSQVDQLRYALTGGTQTTPRQVHALSISGGGNDMGFGPVALVCTLYYDCKNHMVRGIQPGSGLLALDGRFAQSVAAVGAHYAELAAALAPLGIEKTYITQYPDPTRNENGGRCAKILDDVIPLWMAPLLPGLALKEWHSVPLPPYQIDGGERDDGGEVGWAGGPVLSGMNGAVAAAATAHGWTLVDGIADSNANLFSGHGYCAPDNWIRTATESVAMQGPWAPPAGCALAAIFLQPINFVMANCFPPTTGRTTGTLHPTARGYQAIAGQLMTKLKPDLLPAPPAAGPVAPAFSVVRSDAREGRDGWLIGQVAGHTCAGGAAACVPVQVSASVPSTTSLDGVSLAVNGSPLPCSPTGVATGGVFCRSELTNPQTNVWSLSFADGGIHQVEATATARNRTRTDSTFQFKVDLVAPASATAIPLPPATETNGWYRSAVAVQLIGTDSPPGSGVESIEYQMDGGPVQTVPNGTSISVEPDGAHTLVLRPIDRAGHRGALQPPFTVRIDKTPPTLHCATADGAWHAVDVSVSCSASDGGSGLASSGDAGFTLSTSVAAGSETATAETGARSVCDVAGNCVDAGPIGANKVDRKAPTVTVSSPVSTRYLLNQVVSAGYTCADGGSGVATCAGPVPTGSAIDTSAVGERTFTVNASDNVGNPTRETVTYSVGYRICLLYDAARTRNAGSTVPVQLQLCDAGSTNRSSADIVPVAAGVVDADTGRAVPLQSPGNSQPANRFTFDGSSYSFNVSTTGYAPGRYELQFTIPGDPATHVAPFTIR